MNVKCITKHTFETKQWSNKLQLNDQSRYRETGWAEPMRAFWTTVCCCCLSQAWSLYEPHTSVQFVSRSACVRVERAPVLHRFVSYQATPALKNASWCRKDVKFEYFRLNSYTAFMFSLNKQWLKHMYGGPTIALQKHSWRWCSVIHNHNSVTAPYGSVTIALVHHMVVSP